MKDLIYPLLGIVLEYTMITLAVFKRFEVSEWGLATPGGDMLIIGVTAILCTLIVWLFTNFNIVDSPPKT